jgi:hypothetical protein
VAPFIFESVKFISMKKLGEETRQLANEVEAGKKAFVGATAQLATGKPKPSSNQPPPNVANEKPIGTWNIPEKGVTVSLQPEVKNKQEVKQAAKPDPKPIGKWNIPEKAN